MTVRVNKSAFNIREKLSELERPIGVKGNELMRAETAQDARDLVSAGRKNLIINGDFRISQRGNYTSATNTSSNAYYLDRWYHNGSTSNTTVQQKGNQLVNGYNVNTMLYSSASGTNSTISMGQQVETLNWIHLKGKEVTFSAWVKTNNSKVGLRNYSGVQNIGTRHSGSGNWEHLTWSYTITASDTNLYFLIDSYTGVWNDITDQYIEIAMVQIEEGKNATEFEHRSYGEELALCQRYFYRFRCANQEWIYNEGNSSTNKWHQFYIGHPMRSNPSVDVSNLSTGGSVAGMTGVTISSISPQTPGDTPGRISSRVTMSGAAGSANNLYHTDVWQNNYISLSAEI